MMVAPLLRAFWSELRCTPLTPRPTLSLAPEKSVTCGPQEHVWGDLMMGHCPGVCVGRLTVPSLSQRTPSVRSAGNRKEEQSHGPSQPPGQDVIPSKQL